MGNLFGWIRGLREDRRERRDEPMSRNILSDEAMSGNTLSDKPMSRNISSDEAMSTDLLPDDAMSTDLLSEKREKRLLGLKPGREPWSSKKLKAPRVQSGPLTTIPAGDIRVLEIVQEIKQKIPGIQAARACFNPETRRYHITVVSKLADEKRKEIKDMVHNRFSRLKGFDLEVRHICEEGIQVTKSQEFNEFFKKRGYSNEIFKIQRVISKHLDTTIKSEPNITSISFSPVKSTGYGTANHSLVKEPCIVFFVQVKFDKKRIPLGSQRIPENIQGIKTDVREGIVETLMEAHRDASRITLGCPISSDFKTGSLGPIVSTKENSTGFLTSLHVLLSSSELTAVKNYGYDTTTRKIRVYKTTKENKRVKIGKVIKVYFSNGSGEQLIPGYEVGLVKLHPSIHIEGGYTQTNGLAHFNGETTAITEDNRENIFRKLGAVTRLTQGIYVGDNLLLRLTYNETESFDLHCQIGLLSAHYEQDSAGNFILREFAKPGDSGALVTIRVDKTDKAVGIVSGKRTDGVYIVTPIKPIYDRLQMDGWEICSQRNHNNYGEPMDLN